MPFTVIIAFIFTIFITIFAVLNSSEVIIKIPFFGQFGISQAIVIIGSAAVGALIVYIFSLIKQFRLNMTIKKHKKIIKDYEDKINQLENLVTPEFTEDTVDNTKGQQNTL